VFPQGVGENLDVRVFKNLFVSSRNDVNSRATAGKFTPAVGGIKGAPELMAAAAQQTDLTGVGSSMMAKKGMDVRFPDSALIGRVTGKINDFVRSYIRG